MRIKENNTEPSSIFGQYWKLTKSLQTGLLLLTGLAGYSSVSCPVTSWSILLGLSISLFLAIAGSTVLNMVWDRDIDAKMGRTEQRPLVSGRISVKNALLFGSSMSIVGVGIASLMDPLYGIIVFAGLFIDVVIYTMWLKRRTAWSIVWGGISGGMPILAGRVLALGEIDGVGILFTLSILLWIPTHILTFSMRYFDDYQAADVPTFPSRYGFLGTRYIIAISSVGASIAIGLGLFSLGFSWGYLRLLAILSIGLMTLAVANIRRPSEKIDFYLFKYASLYMMGAMTIVSFGSY